MLEQALRLHEVPHMSLFRGFGSRVSRVLRTLGSGLRLQNYGDCIRDLGECIHLFWTLVPARFGCHHADTSIELLTSFR